MKAKVLFNHLRKWLRSREVRSEVTEKNSELIMSLIGERGSWRARIKCEEAPAMLHVMCHFPIFVPKERFHEISVLLHHFNASIRLGSFCLLAAEQGIVFRLPVVIEESKPLPLQFACALATALTTFENHVEPIALAICRSGDAQRKLAALEPTETETSNKPHSLNRIQLN